MQETLGPPSNWIVEWKFDGIRAQLLKRGDAWRLWSRGEELISEAYPDLEPLARALPSGVALDGELVVLIPPAGDVSANSLDGLAPFASLQQRLGRKAVSDKTMRELPAAFIAYDLLECEGRDIRGEPQRERRARLEGLVERDACFCEGARRAAADAPEPRRSRPTIGRGSRSSASRRARSAGRG